MASVGEANAMDRWSSTLAEIDHQRTELARVADILRDYVMTATSADGLLTVTVNARGVLVGLDIDPRAVRRMSSDELALLIPALVAEAVSGFDEQRAHIQQRLAQTPGHPDLAPTPGR